jgi:hypothetical protein
VVLPTEDRDRIRCFANQVKLTRALVRDLDEAVKEIKQVGEHGEEASEKITELEALCKQKEGVTKKLKEEKAKLEGMIQSRDELIMEMADEYRLNCMGENNDDEDDEEDDDNDGGDTTAPTVVEPIPVAVPPTAITKVIIVEEEKNPVEMVLEQDSPEELEIIAPEAELEPPQPRLYTVLTRDYVESSSTMMDDLDDFDDLTVADYNVNKWFPEDGSNDRD